LESPNTGGETRFVPRRYFDVRTGERFKTHALAPPIFESVRDEAKIEQFRSVARESAERLNGAVNHRAGQQSFKVDRYSFIIGAFRRRDFRLFGKSRRYLQRSPTIYPIHDIWLLHISITRSKQNDPMFTKNPDCLRIARRILLSPVCTIVRRSVRAFIFLDVVFSLDRRLVVNPSYRSVAKF